MSKARTPRKPFTVHASMTVAAQANGQRLTHTQRGDPIHVDAIDVTHALELAEIEVARRLAVQYGLLPEAGE